MKECLQGNCQMKRKTTKKGYGEINDLVWEWFTNARF